MDKLKMASYILLVVGGVVHTFPGLYSGLTSAAGGNAIVQIVVGVASVLLGLYMLFMRRD